MSLTPDVSVLMPVGPERDFLAEAARSVLGQSGVALELVVVDDAPDGGARRVVDGLGDPRARVVPCAGRGIADALNTGIDAARGAVVCRCDADDLFPPGRLARQLAALARDPAFGAVCGGMQTIDRRGRAITPTHAGAAAGEVTDEMRRGVTRTSFCTFATRAADLRAAGPLRPWFHTAEDIDLLLRLGERCRVWFEPEVVYLWRLHDDSITHRQPSRARVFYESAARAFQRERAAGGSDALARGTPPEPPSDTSDPLAAAGAAQDLLLGASWQAHREGLKGRAVALGVRALLARPRTLAAWKSLATVALKPIRKL